MEIKRIQLRGISRAPSDRLTEDGGLSESLNMYLDTAESAPAFVPEDVTAKLGLPDDLIAERIFIHKTANYENFIAVQQERIVAYTPNVMDDIEPVDILALETGEKVSDITSMGNTLIISTSKNLYYILYRDRQYSLLGNKVPFPYLNFHADYEETLSVDLTNGTAKHSGLDGYVPVDESWKWPDEEKFLEDYNDLWFAGVIPHEGKWDELEDGKHTFVGAERLMSDVYAAHKEKCEELYNEGKIVNPIVVRYSVDLYGSKTSSVPILVGMNDFCNNNYVKVNCVADIPDGNNIKVENTAELKYTPYKIRAKFEPGQEIDWSKWKDIITNVSIYVSQILPYSVFAPTSTLLARNYSEEIFPNTESIPEATGFVTKKTSSATIRLDESKDYKDDLLFASSQTFLVKRIDVFNENGDLTAEFNDLINGCEIDLSKFFGKEVVENEEGETEKQENETLVVQDRLYGDDMKHYLHLSESLASYNNQVILVQPKQLVDYDYSRLNAYDIVENVPYKTSVVTTTYDVTYLLRTYTEDKVIKKQFVYVQNSLTTESIYAFQVFPDNRVFKMLVKATIVKGEIDGNTGEIVITTEVKYGEFDMLPHPYLDCAYYYGGMGAKLVSLCNAESVEDYDINRMDGMDNKLFISEQDDPFSFPLQHRYTFQSKVVGVAVASTALSQGQFGQFPLYVFTEDGIWAMETAADGSFLTSKPLSREVCINPDSITSVDNAVVFVTDKGVMMISGAQVANISPFMNGKHYLPSDSALGIIKSQEGYSELINAINDKEPFMSFVKSAKVAYDYAGQRLIFMSEGKDFQYVYKTDTQTWHKIAFDGFDLAQPLNSYPDCLVQGALKKHFSEIYCLENMSPLDSYELLEKYGKYFGMDLTYLEQFLFMSERVPLYGVPEKEIVALQNSMREDGINIEYNLVSKEKTCVYDLSTVLDASRSQQTAKGVIITRPFDLDYPDVLKSITDVRVRGEFRRSAVKFILMGSNDGIHWATLGTLRGKSWKLFRIAILADLEPTERISWVDIGFETRFTNRLR